MRKRTRARELALQILFQWDLRGSEILEELDDILAATGKGESVLSFARELVLGTAEHREEADRRISAVAEHWDISRMATIDRNILRMAVYEMLHLKDVPGKVSINEAIELGKKYSTGNSGAFINGILDRILRGIDEEGEKKMVLARLSAGLLKTSRKLAGRLKDLVTGRKVDADLLEEVEEILVTSDVGVEATEKILDRLREAYEEREIESGDEVIPYLKDLLREMLTSDGADLRWADEPPTVVLVAGVNGSGKTTSIAKLAHLFVKEGKKVILAASDTFRAAAVEQLTVWADRLGVQIVKHQTGADPAAVAYDAVEAAVARGADVLLVDTAGRLHTQEHLMRELTKVSRVLGKRIPGAPHECILVLDATTGQNAIQQVRIFSQGIPVSGLFVAKLDGTAKGGAVIAIRDQVDVPVKFVGVGEGPEDVLKFDADDFVEALFA